MKEYIITYNYVVIRIVSYLHIFDYILVKKQTQSTKFIDQAKQKLQNYSKG